jgi:uncharacterized protein YdhG (YjbR/CyaY superfamily)
MDANPNAVDEYMATLEGDAYTIAQQVRQAIHRATPGIDETVRYKLPCFSLDEEYLVYLGAWKKHIGLYPIPALDGDLERDVAPYRAATDTVRFPYNKTVPYGLIERIVVALVDRMRGSAR